MIIFSVLIYLSFIAFIIFNSQKYKKQSNSIHVKDLVSVVIPYFKSKQFFSQSIRSVEKQSYRNKEIIINIMVLNGRVIMDKL